MAFGYDLTSGAFGLGVSASMGGADIEFFNPIRAGDTITARAKIVDIVERQSSKGGWIAIVTRETTFNNQKGEAVAIQKMTSIYR